MTYSKHSPQEVSLLNRSKKTCFCTRGVLVLAKFVPTHVRLTIVLQRKCSHLVTAKQPKFTKTSTPQARYITINIIRIISHVSFYDEEPFILQNVIGPQFLHIRLQISDIILQEGYPNLQIIRRVSCNLKKNESDNYTNGFIGRQNHWRLHKLTEAENVWKGMTSVFPLLPATTKAAIATTTHRINNNFMFQIKLEYATWFLLNWLNHSTS